MRQATETPTYTFTADELEWLTSFKAAVDAGLFDEWAIEPEMCVPNPLLSGTHYPSDPRDITRLLVCRSAVRAGFYHEN